MENTYKELREQINRNLKAIAKKGDISKDDLCSVKEALASIHYLNSIEGTTMPAPTYQEMSYGANRSPITGRYISNGVHTNNSYDTVRMHYGESMPHYQGHSIKDRMIACLEPIMDEAKSEYERQTVMNTIHRIRSEM